MRIVCCVVAAFLFSVSWAQAQSSPYSHILKIYNVGATTPIQSTPAPSGAALCNQEPSIAPTGDVINPTVLEYDDPSNAGKVCRLSLSSFFGGLPIGQRMVGRVVLVDDAAGLTSDESADSNPFVRRAAPPQPAHVRIVKIGGGL